LLAPATTRVSLDVSASAPGARVELDGEDLGPAPVHALVDKEPGSHVVRVEADGYAPEERTIPLDSPAALAFDLRPLHPTAKTPRRPHGREPGLLFDEKALR
jgi:PEGA domain-containing protein